MPKRGSVEAARANFEKLSGSFPKASGKLRDISEQYRAKNISAIECAKEMLRIVTGANTEQELAEAVKQNNTIVRNTKESVWKEDNELERFYIWIVDVKAIRPDTALQYLKRLNRLKAQGYSLESPRELAEELQDTDIANRDQCLAALRLLHDYKKECSK